MATVGSGHDSDPEDWFVEPEPADTGSTRVGGIVHERTAETVDDWVRDTAPPAPRRRPSVRLSPAVAVLTALAVCAVLGILAAAGVFSGGRKPLTVTRPSTQRAPTTATAPAATPRPQSIVPASPLKPGASGAAVAKLQRALASAGYSPGTIDGHYGPGTTQAVTQFQQAHALAADGIAGTQTLAALEAALTTG